ncbi:MAG TPA: zinc-dependent metalloprotease [Candidatus Limnocylindrales bacterium]
MSGRPRPSRESPTKGRATGRSFGLAGLQRDAFMRAGFLVGAAVGAGITILGRRAERSARRGLIDWDKAVRIASARVRRAPGRLSAAELRSAEPVYAAAMARIVPALGAALETELPGVVERSGVVDRETWVETNVATFVELVGKVEGSLLDQVIPDGAGFVKAAMAIANREVATRQLGYFLGFLGQRVLGQYDLALLSAGSTPGQLLFVDENIRRTATLLDLPLDPFRTWIALHETTHAFEFEAHPWLRPYLAGRLEQQLSSLSGDVSMLSRDALARLGRMLRRSNSGEHWMEGLMSEEQRRGFREIQAVMSLLEGFGDYVMDEVGRELVPGVEEISRRFHARRDQRTGFERAMMRITGMDLKMEQYRKGEEFVASIATAGGPQALRALWLGPETLPSPEEIATPARWLDRVMPTNGVPLKGKDV